MAYSSKKASVDLVTFVEACSVPEAIKMSRKIPLSDFQIYAKILDRMDVKRFFNPPSSQEKALEERIVREVKIKCSS